MLLFKALLPIVEVDGNTQKISVFSVSEKCEKQCCSFALKIINFTELNVHIFCERNTVPYQQIYSQVHFIFLQATKQILSTEMIDVTVCRGSRVRVHFETLLE